MADKHEENPSITGKVARLDKVLLVVLVAFFTGFSIGATLTIFGTNRGELVSASSGEYSGRRASPLDEKIRLAESLEKHPKNVHILIDLGNSCFDSGLYQKAIEVYSSALSIDQQNAEVRNDLGVTYRALGQYEKAVAVFRQATLDDPLHARSWYNLGLVLAWDMGDDRGAIDAWEEFLARGPCTNRNIRRLKMVKSETERMKKGK